nr:hypothetical protein [Pedobacter panaciterrae]
MKRHLILILLLQIGNFLYAQTNVFPTTGNVGIGTTNPGAELSFKSVSAGTESVGITWHSPAPLNYGIHRTMGAWGAPNYQQLRVSWTTGVILDPGSAYAKSYVDIVGGGLRVTSGNVGIGSIDTKGYKLAVNGKIRAQEIKVETANWPDYVFAKGYQLPSLQEIEQHIKDKGHLHGIPSAEEVKADGVDLGEMNAKLLQKIEELTLYLIEQNKQVMEQNKTIEVQNNNLTDQAKKLALQEADIEYLKSRLK